MGQTLTEKTIPNSGEKIEIYKYSERHQNSFRYLVIISELPGHDQLRVDL